MAVHPDLPVYRAKSENKSVVLLGYILDPYDPRASDRDIVDRMLTELANGGTRDSFIRSTDPLGGRWILIVEDGRNRFLFNDPVGYRQVFYSRSISTGLWCASQPGPLAEILGLTPDDRAIAFIQAYRRHEPQYWWPGDSSLYSEIRHLLPNHYLDLMTGYPHRFWPDRDLEARPLDEVVRENASRLQGLLASASNRFQLALSMTAGKDTRLLLAASKAIRHRLYYYTMIFWDLTTKSPDIQIPSKLLSQLGLPHHVIRCPPQMNREFRRIYQRNVTTAHDVYGSHAQGLYHHYPRARVCMMGTAAPITTVSFAGRLRRHQKDRANGMYAETLAQAMNIRGEPDFALEALDRWISGASHTNVGIEDLFYWENREGNWAAMIYSEWDIVREVFVPFDCRLFLTSALSVPESLREKPAYALQTGLIRHLWPEVLDLPVNPTVEPTLASTARKFLRRPGHKDLRWLNPRSIANWLSRGQ